jgi:aspartate/methionine/tyrosine aminotransferase
MCQEYQRHRDLAVQMLGSLQIPFFKPQGTFYLLVDISAYGLDSYTLAKRLVREARVAVAPGDTFGPGGKNYVRISLAPTAEAIQEGLARFGRFMTT